MLKSNLNVLFYLKKPKGYRSGTLPIYVRIGVDGISKEISTKWNCEPQKWHTKFQKAMGSSEDVRTLNADIAKLLSKIYTAEEALRKNDAIVTADAIKQIISGKSSANHLLLGIFKKHNENMFALIGKDYAKGTFERYETSLEHTRTFIKYKYGTDDIDIKKLNFDFISGYEFWLKTVRNCNHNTTMKYLANFRKIINSCIRHGWLSKDPFVGFKMTKKEVIKVILTDEELKTIREKSFCTPRLNHIRDIFIFCCYTGLAYADVYKLTKDDIIIGIDKKLWIQTTRQKTNTGCKVPLLAVPLSILNQYQLHPQCINSGKLLPVPSNQKMNAYLKEIADICGINKLLTFHTARHTFATTVTLSNGVPIETISKMLGHTSIKTTQIYAKVLDRKISQDMGRLEQSMQG